MAYILYNKDIVEILLLFLLQKEDLYAYQIMKMVEALSDGILTVQGGTLYPILYKLTDKGYVTDRVELVGKRQRMTRVYYHLTSSGKAHLQELLAENDLVQQGMQSVFKNAEKENQNEG